MSDFKVHSIQIKNTQDLRNFFLQLKSWAEAEKENAILDRILLAEGRGMTASELILEYGNSLRDIRSKFRDRLPEAFQSQLDAGILVATEGISLGSPLRASRQSK